MMAITGRLRRTTGVVLSTAVLLAACSADGDDADPAAATGDEATTAGGDEATSAPPATSEATETTDEIACGPLDEPATVTVSISSPNMAFAAVEMAEEMGVYDEMNIDLRVEALGAPDALAPLAQGQIDAIISVLSAGLLNSMAEGIDIRWAAPLYTVHPDAGEGLWYQPDLVPEGEEFDISLMEGKTVATPAGLGGTSTFILAEQMLDAGLTFDDVTYRQMGTADILAALESGALDMGWLSDPFWQQAEEAGLAYWRGFGDQNGTAILTGPGLNDRPEVAVAFFQAISESTSRYLQGDYLSDPETQEALANILQVETDQLVNPYPHQFDPELALPAAEEFATAMQETYIEVGGLMNYDEPLDPSQIIDRTFAERGAACASE